MTHGITEDLIHRNGIPHPVQYLTRTDNHYIGQRLKVVQEVKISLECIFMAHEPSSVDVEAKGCSIGVVVTLEVVDDEVGKSFDIFRAEI